MKRLIVSTVVLAATAISASAQAGSCCGSSSCPMGNNDPRDARSFAVQLPTIAGETLDLSGIIGQSPLVIACLGTGSAVDPTARLLEAAAAAHPDVVFVAALCDVSAVTKKRVRGLKLTIPVVLDPDGAALGICGTTGSTSVVYLNAVGGMVSSDSVMTAVAMDQGLAAIAEPSRVTDPVCGMTIDLGAAAGSYEYESKTYYFCSANCLSLFKQNPGKYVKG